MLETWQIDVWPICILAGGLHLAVHSSMHVITCHDYVQVTFSCCCSCFTDIVHCHFSRIRSLINIYIFVFRSHLTQPFYNCGIVVRMLIWHPIPHHIDMVGIDTCDHDLLSAQSVQGENILVLEKNNGFTGCFKGRLSMLVTKTHFHWHFLICIRIFKQPKAELRGKDSSYRLIYPLFRYLSFSHQLAYEGIPLGTMHVHINSSLYTLAECILMIFCGKMCIWKFLQILPVADDKPLKLPLIPQHICKQPSAAVTWNPTYIIMRWHKRQSPGLYPFYVWREIYVSQCSFRNFRRRTIGSVHWLTSPCKVLDTCNDRLFHRDLLALRIKSSLIPTDGLGSHLTHEIRILAECLATPSPAGIPRHFYIRIEGPVHIHCTHLLCRLPCNLICNVGIKRRGQSYIRRINCIVRTEGISMDCINTEQKRNAKTAFHRPLLKFISFFERLDMQERADKPWLNHGYYSVSRIPRIVGKLIPLHHFLAWELLGLGLFHHIQTDKLIHLSYLLLQSHPRKKIFHTFFHRSRTILVGYSITRCCQNKNSSHQNTYIFDHIFIVYYLSYFPWLS